MSRSPADAPWTDRGTTLALILGGGYLLGARGFSVWPFGTDVAELTLCAVTAGVPHSPGYPLWTRLAGLATALQPGSHPVEAISWMVVGMAIGAAVLTRALLRELEVGPWAATAAGALLLAVPLCMRAFSVPEVHSLDLLLNAGCLWAVARGRRTRREIWTALGAGLAVLAIGHRPINGMLLVAIVVGWQVPLHRSRAALRGIGAGGALQLLLYVDLGMRIHRPGGVWVDEAALPTVTGFLNFVTGLTFSRFFIWSPTGSGLSGGSFHLGMQGWGLVLAALLAPLVLRPRRLGWGLLSLALGHLLFIGLYRVPDIEFFFLPVFWVGLLVAGAATERLPRRLRSPAGGLLLTAVVGLAYVNHQALDVQEPEAWQEELQQVLASVPEDAVVISDDWPLRTGLVAIREIDGVGTGVEIARVSADAEGAQRLEAWLRGEAALILLEEHKELTALRPLRIYDDRLLPHLQELGLRATPAEAGTFRVSLEP